MNQLPRMTVDNVSLWNCHYSLFEFRYSICSQKT